MEYVNTNSSAEANSSTNVYSGSVFTFELPPAFEVPGMFSTPAFDVPGFSTSSLLSSSLAERVITKTQNKVYIIILDKFHRVCVLIAV